MECGNANYFLSDDLLKDILSRLPVRDLLCFRCVCKSWRLLVDDSSFIWMHHHVQYAIHFARSDVPFLLWKHPDLMYNQFRCYLLSNFQRDNILLDFTSDVERARDSAFPSVPDPNVRLYLDCRGTAKGIICLEIERNYHNQKIYEGWCGLWNPATRDFKIVNFPEAPDHRVPRGFRIVAFMYDSVSNDFKIMATACVVSSKDNLAYDIYSLSTNSWKRLNEQPLLCGCLAKVSIPTMDACLNGVYYWIASVYTALPPTRPAHDFQILSFNVTTETFKFSDPPQEVLPPSYDNDYSEFTWDIGLYKESLALFYTRRVYIERVATVKIWAVTEFGDDFAVPLAWQCVFSYGPFPARWGPSVRTPRMDGEHLFIIEDENLCLYNPTTGKFRDLSIKVHYCFTYVESLFPLSRRVVQS